MISRMSVCRDQMRRALYFKKKKKKKKKFVSANSPKKQISFLSRFVEEEKSLTYSFSELLTILIRIIAKKTKRSTPDHREHNSESCAF